MLSTAMAVLFSFSMLVTAAPALQDVKKDEVKKECCEKKAERACTDTDQAKANCSKQANADCKAKAPCAENAKEACKSEANKCSGNKS